MFCDNCGAKIENNARFCTKCGARTEVRIVEDIPDIQSMLGLLEEGNDYPQLENYDSGFAKKNVSGKRKRDVGTKIAMLLLSVFLFLMIIMGGMVFILDYQSHYDLDEDLLFPVRKADGKWAYMDGTGHISEDLVFDFASYFASNGLALVKLDGKCGYIDRKGQFKIPLSSQFSDAYPFNEAGVASVLIPNKAGYGYIDESGDLVNTTILERHGCTDDLLPLDGNISENYIDENGECSPHMTILERQGYTPDMISTYLDGYVDETGKFVILPKFKVAGNFAANGLAAVCDEENDKWGYIDKTGEYVISPQFSMAEDFAANGLAAVHDEEYNCGYVNEEGELQIPLQFDDARSFSKNGLAAVRDKESGKWGYIDETGEYVIIPCFRSAHDFGDNGLAAVENRRHKWGYIDKTGDYVISPRFGRAEDFSGDGTAIVEVRTLFGRKYGLINNSGDFVFKPQHGILNNGNNYNPDHYFIDMRR